MVTNMASFNNDVQCPIAATLEYIGGRWKTIILYYLSSGKKRFGEIAVRLPTISRKVLTQQLKELEKHRLITREQYKEIPPRVEYSLTELGKSLSSVFDEMAVWGKTNILGNR
jgi:DNA-binding HxlR family transcriptional regulator